MKTVVKAALLFVMFSGCDPFDNKLMISNNSVSRIYFEISNDGLISKNPVLVDSLSMDTLWSHMNVIAASDSLRIPLLGRDRWIDYINNECKDSTLTIFIFEEKLLQAHEKKDIVLKQLYSKKYSYTVKDLNSRNWRIVHAGSE